LLNCLVAELENCKIAELLNCLVAELQNCAKGIAKLLMQEIELLQTDH